MTPRMIGYFTRVALKTVVVLSILKYANSKNSISNIFSTKNGNIFYEKTNQLWSNGSCKYCGANEKSYSRDASLETYAYNFIHNKIEKSFVSVGLIFFNICRSQFIILKYLNI